MSIKTGEQSRFTDLTDEPIDHLLSPIKGYSDKPLVSLIEAVQSIETFFNEIQDYVYVALHNCKNLSDELNQQESASIHLYTMQFDSQPSLYHLLNQSLRAENRDELKPWFSYLKLFLTALYKLPSQSKIVWRGIKNVNLSSRYKKGTEFAWWGVSSCTTDIEVIESFLGKTGERTMFSIECVNGKSISNHSYFKNMEKEIILMPGSYFEVIGTLNPAPQLYIIQLKEIPSPITLVKSPFTKSSTDISSSSSSSPDQSTNPISRIPTQSPSDLIPREEPQRLNNEWKHDAIVVAGGNGKGNQLNQFYCPYGICIDNNQTIYIADCQNHRIIEWKANSQTGRIVAGGNGKGKQTNQLNNPTNVIIDNETNSLIIADSGNGRVLKWSLENNTTNGEIIIQNVNCWGLAMDKDGSLYVSDYQRDKVKRWKKGENKGTIIASGIGQDDQLNSPTFIFVDDNYSLYISDRENHRVVKWTKDSKHRVIVAGGNGQGNSLKQLSRPQGLFVDQLGQIYIVDSGNDRVICWREGDTEGKIIVGEDSREKQSNQLHGPVGLTFDVRRNLYVVDNGNDRIVKFEVDLN